MGTPTISDIFFVAFGIVPLFTRFVSIVLFQTSYLDKLRTSVGQFNRIFFWFTSFSIFAQNPDKITHAVEWGYQLINEGSVVEEGPLPFEQGLFTFLILFKKFEPHQCESYTEFILNELVESNKVFDEFALVMMTKKRPELPEGLWAKVATEDFLRSPFEASIVFSCEV